MPDDIVDLLRDAADACLKDAKVTANLRLLVLADDIEEVREGTLSLDDFALNYELIPLRVVKED